MVTGPMVQELPGCSKPARYIYDQRLKSQLELRSSAALGTESLIQGQLAEVWNECSSSNWDGYGASPISQESLIRACILLQSYPLGYPLPTVGAEPDGEITLEWYRTPQRTLSISIAADGSLHYAALMGANSTHGTEIFYGEFPKCLLDLVRRVSH